MATPMLAHAVHVPSEHARDGNGMPIPRINGTTQPHPHHGQAHGHAHSHAHSHGHRHAKRASWASPHAYVPSPLSAQSPPYASPNLNGLGILPPTNSNNPSLNPNGPNGHAHSRTHAHPPTPGYLNPKHARHFSELPPSYLRPPETPQTLLYSPASTTASGVLLSPWSPAEVEDGSDVDVGEPGEEPIELGTPGLEPVMEEENYGGGEGEELEKSVLYREALAGTLVAMPYLFASFLAADTTTTVPDATVDGDATPTPLPRQRALIKSLALLSLTFLAASFPGLIKHTSSHRPPPPQKASPLTHQTLAATALALFLPFYATFHLPATRVPLALLLASTSTLLPTSSPSHLWLQLKNQKLLSALLAAMFLSDALGLTAAPAPALGSLIRGYAALALSAFALQPPFCLPQITGVHHDTKLGIGIEIDRSPDVGPRLTRLRDLDGPQSRLVATTGGVIGVVALVFAAASGGLALQVQHAVFGVAAAVALVGALGFAGPGGRTTTAEKGSSRVGVLAGAVFTVVADMLVRRTVGWGGVVGVVFAGVVVVGSGMEGGGKGSRRRSGVHGFHTHSHEAEEASRATRWLLTKSEPWPLLHSILKERDSRKIFYFMALNFGFMLVQMAYGVVTGSLGLLSDSIHMLFDCVALAVGLVAAVMSKWPATPRFPFGYGKIDTLAGFANGVFLMIISIEIVYEAADRLMAGAEVQHIGELLFVSTAGLLVNLVGIMSFDHAHMHHGHDHAHDHAHGHNENMHGIFLHVLADTLGSVAVVLSTILVHYYDWSGFDPIASCIIAVLIFASAVPLVMSASKKLLLELPGDVEYSVRDSLGELGNLKGVAGYTKPRFWLDDREGKGDDHGHGHDHHGHDHGHAHDSHDHHHDHHGHHHHHHDESPHSPSPHAASSSLASATQQHVLGVIHVIAARNSSLEDVRKRTINFLRQRNMDVTVQVERENDGRCWCGGGNQGMG